MKRKGFTLIELLAVITVIGLLAVVLFPAITGIIEKSNEDAYNIQIGRIEKATQNWAMKYNMVVPNENKGTMTIYIRDLKKAGLIDLELINPLTKKKFKDDMEIIIKREGKGFTYIVNKESGSKTEDIDMGIGSIVLMGLPYQYVEINDNYIEKGAKGISRNGKEIPDSSIVKSIYLNDKKVSSIDTSKFNEYEIVYEMVEEGKAVRVKRKVKIRDTRAPKITMPLNTVLSTSAGSFGIKEGVSATDNSKEKIEIEASGNVTLGVPGMYVIKYTAQDSSGNKTVRKRTVTITGDICTRLYVKGSTKTGLAVNKDVTLTASLENGKEAEETTYQWQKYVGNTWTNIVGETRRTYTEKVEVNGRYRVNYKQYECTSSSNEYIIFIDKTNPTISANPSSGAYVKNRNVTITVGDTGGSNLSTSNSYQYYLSTSSTGLAGGTWSNYTSGNGFTIGTGLTGTYYLYVKRVSDSVGNISIAGGSAVTVGSETYQRFGSYQFDNTAPTLAVNPASGGYAKNRNVTITAADTGGSNLSTSNSYQYYLSTSSTGLAGGTWSNYTNGSSVNIGTGKTGTFYLFVKRVSDSVGNISTAGGSAVTVGSETYQRFGSYQFDNIVPTVSVSPGSSGVVKNITLNISASDTGGSNLSASNTYQYYVSTSSTALAGGAWFDYLGNANINIGTGMTGTYYIFVKRVTDNADNISIGGGATVNVGGVNYQRFGSYIFKSEPPACPTFTGNIPDKSWSNQQLTIDVKPTSDTASYDYYVSDSAGKDYIKYATKTEPFTDVVGGEGIRIAKTVVRDDFGNSRECYSKEYWIDRTAPSCPALPGNIAQTTWSNQQLTIDVSPTSDTVSYDYYVSDGEGKTYIKYYTSSAPFTDSVGGDGIRRAKVVVRDSLGNSRDCYSGEYWIDKTAPTYTYGLACGTNIDNVPGARMLVRVYVSDNLSGYHHLTAKHYHSKQWFTNEVWRNGLTSGAESLYFAQRSGSFYIDACDRAGNCSHYGTYNVSC